MTFVALMVVAASGQAVVDTARAYLGYPYAYGGEGGGFDCSSLVQTVYATHGYHLPRTSGLQAGAGRSVPWEALEPGDLLFFSDLPGGKVVGHVGIAVDRQRMIHASTGRAEVVMDPLEMRYYRERRLSARRILDVPPTAYPPGEPAGADSEGSRASILTGGAGQSLWHHGPLPLARVRTALGVSAGAATLAGERAAFLVPRLALHSAAFDIDLVAQAPFAARLPDWQPLWSPLWSSDAPLSYLRLLERLRVGRPESALYIEASRTLSLSLGQGMLVDRTTPAAYYGSFAGLPVHAPFALASRVAVREAEAELVLDDVVAPAVVGVLVGYGSDARVRAIVAGDPNAPSAAGRRARGGVAIEGVLPLVDVRALSFSADVSVAGLDNAAAGVESGAWLKLRHGKSELALRGAVHVHDPGFAPHIFGVDYRAVREQGVGGEPLWDHLDALAGTAPWRWGFALTGQLTMSERFGARVGYRNSLPLAREGALGEDGALELGVLARDIYTARGGSLSAHASYHRRAGSDGVLSLDNEREIVFAGLRINNHDRATVGVQVAKRTRAARSVWEAMADLSLDLGPSPAAD